MNGGSRHSALRWGGSLATVLAAHASAVAAFLDFTPPPEPPPPQAVMMVELAPNVAAPRSEKHDLTPGPQQERARPQETTPETPPEKQQVKDKVVAKSEVALPAKTQPKPKKRKTEPQVTPVPDPEPQEQRPPAEIATAPPAVAAPVAPTATAPAPGVATVPTPMNKDAWRSALMAHIQRHLRYPGIAQARRQEGVVWVQFAMTCQGKVLSSSIRQSSSVQVLDREALAVLARAQPLPAPSDRADDHIELAVPVKFNLP
ncbi:MAG: energy transducer TonB [Magnetospirillum sp.]|nr:energy transducer TonB [Magnetospirillum sp.]